LKKTASAVFLMSKVMRESILRRILKTCLYIYDMIFNNFFAP